MCFMHCLFMMYGWMDEEGGFNLHFVKTELDAAQVAVDSIEFVLYKCTAIQSVDRCERAFEFLKCFWETMEEVIVQKTKKQFFCHDFCLQQERQRKSDEVQYNGAFKRFLGGGNNNFLLD